MFNIRRPITHTAQKQRVPSIIWILMFVAAILGIFCTRSCQNTHDSYLKIDAITIESQTAAYAQIYFEITNTADFSIDRKVIIRLYSDKSEIGSKMILATLPSKETKSFLKTVDLNIILDTNRHIDEVFVGFKH